MKIKSSLKTTLDAYRYKIIGRMYIISTHNNGNLPLEKAVEILEEELHDFVKLWEDDA